MKKLSLYKTQYYALGAIALVLVFGFSYIVYTGRPAYQMKQEPVVTTSSTTPMTQTETPTKQENTFSLAQIATHNTPADCWSTINGSVYDLSTWVSRHPGGSKPIEGLCGTDGSEKFSRVHGKSNPAQAALVLLKIGTLQKE